MLSHRNDEGDLFVPFQDPDSQAVGWQVTHGPDGPNAGLVEYIMLNPSGDRDDDGYPTVFVYIGPTGDPSNDEAVTYLNLFDGFAAHQELTR